MKPAWIPAADRALRIARAKIKARNYLQIFDTLAVETDCGLTMLKEINPDAADAARKYNEAMFELRCLDPKCPEFIPL